MEEKWYTTKEASEYLKVSQMTIFRWMKSGKLTHFKIGGALRFTKNDLDQIAKKNTGSIEAEMKTEKCSVCGNSELLDGRLQGTGRLYFKPAKTKFFVFAESLVGLTSKMCTACGFIQMFGNTEKLSKLKPEEKEKI
jgi:excisionase family DNA binding protein